MSAVQKKTEFVRVPLHINGRDVVIAGGHLHRFQPLYGAALRRGAGIDTRGVQAAIDVAARLGRDIAS